MVELSITNADLYHSWWVALDSRPQQIVWADPQWQYCCTLTLVAELKVTRSSLPPSKGDPKTATSPTAWAQATKRNIHDSQRESDAGSCDRQQTNRQQPAELWQVAEVGQGPSGLSWKRRQEIVFLDLGALAFRWASHVLQWWYTSFPLPREWHKCDQNGCIYLRFSIRTNIWHQPFFVLP